MWHVYQGYREAQLIAVCSAFRSCPLQVPLKYDFILYFLTLRQSGTGRGYPSVCKLFIIWTFEMKISCFLTIQFNYKLEGHSSTDGTGNLGVLLLTVVLLQHLHLSLK